MQELFALHQPNGPERCGVILDDGSILELENVHPDPVNYFAMDKAAVDASNVVATWHTHPRTGPCLSVGDFRSFVSMPRLLHYIVAATEIWCYGMSGDILLSHDNNHFIRPSEGALPEGNPG